MKALLPTLALLAALPAGAAEPVVVKSVESAAGPKPLSWKHSVAFEGEAGDDKLAVVLEVQVPPAADVRPANDKTAVERLSPTLYSVSGKLEKTGDAKPALKLQFEVAGAKDFAASGFMPLKAEVVRDTGRTALDVPPLAGPVGQPGEGSHWRLVLGAGFAYLDRDASEEFDLKPESTHLLVKNDSSTRVSANVGVAFKLPRSWWALRATEAVALLGFSPDTSRNLDSFGLGLAWRVQDFLSVYAAVNRFRGTELAPGFEAAAVRAVAEDAARAKDKGAPRDYPGFEKDPTRSGLRSYDGFPLKRPGTTTDLFPGPAVISSHNTSFHVGIVVPVGLKFPGSK